ncbi:MAG: alkane 1-monooxygenase [Pseudorhodobacter sp.]|nr:alkane 1-monooxygenase [Pseudorhodobacter sp.]
MTSLPTPQVMRFSSALPYWISLIVVPVTVTAALYGGWAIALIPLASWGLFSLLDALAGLNTANEDPETPEPALFWYKLVTIVWLPIQVCLLIWLLWYVPRADHLSTWEAIAVFFGMGVASGTVGINFSHELMHQKSRLERAMSELLLASVLYGHFRSEHLRVHHLYVCTPRDPVTARYNEGFHRFYPRVLWQCLVSSFQAERAMLARRGLPVWHRTNPFWRYLVAEAGFVALAMAISGWAGLGLFLVQAGVAIWQLELVNYVEHYGLTRRHLGNGKYEHVLPRHSWNAAHKASNWLLINLQRHSDHHYKPDRRYPLLQTYGEADAPQLPYGYAGMTAIAMIPPLWKRIMNRRVRAWRKRHYPDIQDWKPYNKALNPLPR